MGKESLGMGKGISGGGIEMNFNKRRENMTLEEWDEYLKTHSPTEGMVRNIIEDWGLEKQEFFERDPKDNPPHPSKKLKNTLFRR